MNRLLSISILGSLLLSGAATADRLTALNFEYVGAFRLPGRVGAGQFVNGYGQRGMTFDSDGDSANADSFPGSLWITGHDYTEDVFEVSIPIPKKTRDYDSLRYARTLSAPFDFTDSCNNGSDWLSGIEIHESRLWGSCAERYNVTGNDYAEILWTWDLDLTYYDGPFHAGPLGQPEFHSNRQGAYLVSIPQGFADEYLGGRTLATGMVRNSHGGAPGPTLLAFDPDAPSDGFDVFWYRPGGTTQCSESHICDLPDYTPCDEWNGASWVSSGGDEALLLSGANYYGEVAYEGGWICDPGYAEILFYDPDDFVERVQGALEPWEVLPYDRWRPAERWSSGGRFGGMAFDGANDLLYVVEKSAAVGGKAIVHVYRVLADAVFLDGFEEGTTSAWP